MGVYERIIDTFQKNNLEWFLVGNPTEDASAGAAIYYHDYWIDDMIEKPPKTAPPTDLNNAGCYIFPPEIFEALRSIKPGKGGEVWLIDAINLLKEQGVPVYTVEIEGAKYYDTGNKLEYMKTAIELGLQHPEIGEDLKQFLKELNLS